MKDFVCSPIDLVKKVWLRLLQANEPVAAIVSRAENEIVSIEERPGFFNIFGGEIGAVGADDADARGVVE